MNRIPILEMCNIAGAFDKFYALRRVDLTVWPDETHALVDEDSAGRSTLMKILAGVYTVTSNEVPVDGQSFHVRGPKDVLSAGITLIYQEIQLAPNLTVAENIFLDSELPRDGLVQRKEMVMQSQKVVGRLGTQFRANDRVTTLTTTERQQVGITRVPYRNSRILVMDEPATILSSRETHRLLELVMRLHDEGMTIVYISHRIVGVCKLSDRVSASCDGQYVDSLVCDKFNASGLVRMTVGRPLSNLFNKERDIPLGKVRLNIHHLTDGNKVQPYSLLVHSEEIVSLAGLVGTERSESAQLVFDVRKVIGGMVEIGGEPVVVYSPREVIDRGIGFLTENRKEQGLFLELTATENIAIATLERDADWGMLNRRKAQAISDDAIRLLDIRVPHVQVRVDGLSNGNQQRPPISCWVAVGSCILTPDGPVRGVGVGARSGIYRIMSNMVRKSVTVLIISSELPEVVSISDHVYVIQEGNTADELNRQNIIQGNIMMLTTGVNDSHHQTVPHK